MAADYPAAYTTNAQNTSNDSGGDDTDALAGDYNKHDEEIAAISGDLVAAFGVESAATMLAAMTAILGGHADGAVWCGAGQWQDGAAGGNWTRTASGAMPRWIRTPNAGSDTIHLDAVQATRAAAAKGLTLTSVDVVYSIATAILGTDVSANISIVTLGGDTVTPVVAGVAKTMDTAHDTAGERVAIQDHTATMTVTVPAKLAITEGLVLTVAFDDTTGAGTGAVTFYGATLHFTRADVSGA